MHPLLICLLLSAAAPPFEVQTLDGQTLVGPLVEIAADRLTIDAAGGRKSLEIGQLVSAVSRQKPAAPRPAAGLVVGLTDGSTIVAERYLVQAARAKIGLADGQTLEAPTNIVRTVQFQHPSAALAAEWSRLAAGAADGDLLVVRREDSLDYHKGVLHDVTDDSVRFELDGEVLPVKRSKIFGIAYRHGVPAGRPEAICRITDANGSQWAAHQLGMTGKLQWTTPAGLTAAQPLDKIVAIDFSAGKIVYLSELKPEDVRWTPYFGPRKPLAAEEQFYAPRFDRNVDGGPLVLAGASYRKGLALHGHTELMYRLPGSFGHFRAVAGIDDAVRPGGKTRLVVRGDDKILLDAVILGDEPPRNIDLELASVRRLTIVVDFPGSLSAGNDLLLCNARLSK
jgi:hypothetical protein